MDNNNINKPEVVRPHYVVLMNEPPQQSNSAKSKTISIDFIKLLTYIYQQRFFMLKFMAAGLVVAYAFTWTLKPKYETTAKLLPPAENTLIALKNNLDMVYTANDLFKSFINRAADPGNAIAFVKESGFFNSGLSKAKNDSERAQYLNKYASNFKLHIYRELKTYKKKDNKNNKDKSTSSKADKSVVLETQLVSLTPKIDYDGKKMLAYLAYTNQKIVANIQQEQRATIASKISTLEKELKLLVNAEKLKRQITIINIEAKQKIAIETVKAEIKALEDKDLLDKKTSISEWDAELQTARAAGVEEDKRLERLYRSKLGPNMVVEVGEDKAINDELYFRGSKYLDKKLKLEKAQQHSLKYEKEISALKQKLYLLSHNAELDALKARKDDRPFTPDIIAKEILLAQLRAINFDTKNLQVYRLVAPPFADISPIMANKRLIKLSSVLGGLLLAFIIVFFRGLVQSTKQDLMVSA